MLIYLSNTKVDDKSNAIAENCIIKRIMQRNKFKYILKIVAYHKINTTFGSSLYWVLIKCLLKF